MCYGKDELRKPMKGGAVRCRMLVLLVGGKRKLRKITKRKTEEATMKKRILSMLLASVMVMSMSMSSLASDKGGPEEGIDPQLVEKPVFSSMTDADGNEYTAIGQCFEGASNVVAACTICEVYKCKQNEYTVNNKYKTVKVENASLLTPTGMMYIPNASRTNTGKSVSIYTQITNAPFWKISLGAEHRIIIGSHSWYAVSTCELT